MHFFLFLGFSGVLKPEKKHQEPPKTNNKLKYKEPKTQIPKKNKNTKTHDRTQLSASSPPPLGVFNLIMFGFLVLMFASLGFVCCKKGKKL
jgi:hypothetical protein